MPDDVGLDLKAVQVRLPADAMRALVMLSEIEGKDYGEKAREILTRALMGEAHAAIELAERIARATRSNDTR